MSAYNFRLSSVEGGVELIPNTFTCPTIKNFNNPKIIRLVKREIDHHIFYISCEIKFCCKQNCNKTPQKIKNQLSP